MWLVLRHGLIQIATGLGLGLLASWALSRVIGSLLAGVPPTDPPTFVIVASLLATVTLGACFVPSRRAAKLNPVDALRVE